MRVTSFPALPVLVLLLVGADGRWAVGEGDNLLVNPSFELEPKGTWEDAGFKAKRVTDDAKDGQHALLVSNRNNENSGPMQVNIPFVKGRHYGFEGYVKLLNDAPDKMWQIVKANIQVIVTETGAKQGYNIAFRSFCNTSQDWILLKGDIEAPQVDFTDARLAIRGPDPEINFLVDHLALYELPEEPLWRQIADANIEQFRKADITLNVNLPSGVQPSDFEVEVQLKRHEFAFGSMLRYDEIMKEPTTKLMEIAYSFFQWGSIQNYKWRFQTGNLLDKPNMMEAIEATKKLKARRMKVRGHCIFWDVDKNVPEKVRNVSAEDTTALLRKHLRYEMTMARNLLDHWDVQNEHIAMHYYEEKTKDPRLTKRMFQWAKQMNDSGTLFINEFQCITSGAQTEQLYDLAKEYLGGGIPLEGLGVQGHTKEFVQPDPTAMWRRIDRLAELGLPIMMTEYDLAWKDVMERADWFEDSIRAFFGHPSMVGVILWDFWNETMRYPYKDLVRGTGDDLEILEPGQRWACLVNKEWHTHKKFRLSSASSTLSLRGFKGDYEVVVRKGGNPVQKAQFYLGDKGNTWNLNVNSSTDPIEVETKKDFVPQCISHREQRSLGTAMTSSTDGGLTCQVVKSGWSGLEPNDVVSVPCPAGEVMTSCMSMQRDTQWKRNGEKMGVDPNSGTATCYAYNGHEQGGGVRAFAICCKGAGLQCDYQTAGPSFPFDGAMAEAVCASGETALGCSSYSRYPMSDGVRPREDVTGCRAQSGGPYLSQPEQKSGVMVYSACCKASTGALQCRVETTKASGLSSESGASVSCPAGTVLTGCSAFAQDGKAAGAKVLEGGQCSAKLGDDLPTGSTGVQAYAICCSV